MNFNLYYPMTITHHWTYDHVSAYRLLSNLLDRVKVVLPADLRLIVHKTMYVILGIIPQVGFVAIPAAAFAMLRGRVREMLHPTLIGPLTWILHNALNFFYPYDVLTDFTEAYHRKQLPETTPLPDAISRVLTHLNGKGSVLLHGGTGAGKSAIPRALVSIIEGSSCPPNLKGKRVLALNLEGLLQNSEFLWLNLTNVLLIAKLSNAILFIDEFHRLEQLSHGSKLSDTLKLYIRDDRSQGKDQFVQVVGATTDHEWKTMLQNDPAFPSRLFSVQVDISKEKEGSRVIIDVIKKNFPHITFDSGSIERAISISNAHLPHMALPNRALHVIRAAISYKAMQNQSLDVLSEQDVQKTEELRLIENPFHD